MEMASKTLLMVAAVFQTLLSVGCFPDFRHVEKVPVRVKRQFGVHDGGFRACSPSRGYPLITFLQPPSICQPCFIYVGPPAIITSNTVRRMSAETGSRSMMKPTESGHGRGMTSIDDVSEPIEVEIGSEPTDYEVL